MYDKRPEVKINRSNDEQVKLVNVRKLYLKKKLDKRKCSFETMIINGQILNEYDFYHALHKWYDILLFAYGTHKSAYVNIILTEFCGECINYRDVIREMEDRWNAGR
jgi:hypothetical protein